MINTGLGSLCIHPIKIDNDVVLMFPPLSAFTFQKAVLKSPSKTVTISPFLLLILSYFLYILEIMLVEDPH